MEMMKDTDDIVVRLAFHKKCYQSVRQTVSQSVIGQWSGHYFTARPAKFKSLFDLISFPPICTQRYNLHCKLLSLFCLPF